MKTAHYTTRMDEAGITEKRLLKVLDEGLSATKTHFNQKTDGAAEEKTYNDYAVRHRYLDTALKLRDMFPAEKKKLQHNFNNITPKDERQQGSGLIDCWNKRLKKKFGGEGVIRIFIRS